MRINNIKDVIEEMGAPYCTCNAEGKMNDMFLNSAELAIHLVETKKGFNIQYYDRTKRDTFSARQNDKKGKKAFVEFLESKSNCKINSAFNLYWENKIH